MLFFILQTLFLALLAFLIGLFLGRFLKKIFCKNSSDEKLTHHVDNLRSEIDRDSSSRFSSTGLKKATMATGVIGSGALAAQMMEEREVAESVKNTTLPDINLKPSMVNDEEREASSSIDFSKPVSESMNFSGAVDDLSDKKSNITGDVSLRGRPESTQVTSGTGFEGLTEKFDHLIEKKNDEIALESNNETETESVKMRLPKNNLASEGAKLAEPLTDDINQLNDIDLVESKEKKAEATTADLVELNEANTLLSNTEQPEKKEAETTIKISETKPSDSELEIVNIKQDDAVELALNTINPSTFNNTDLNKTDVSVLDSHQPAITKTGIRIKEDQPSDSGLEATDVNLKNDGAISPLIDEKDPIINTDELNKEVISIESENKLELTQTNSHEVTAATLVNDATQEVDDILGAWDNGSTIDKDLSGKTAGVIATGVELTDDATKEADDILSAWSVARPDQDNVSVNELLDSPVSDEKAKTEVNKEESSSVNDPETVRPDQDNDKTETTTEKDQLPKLNESSDESSAKTTDAVEDTKPEDNAPASEALDSPASDKKPETVAFQEGDQRKSDDVLNNELTPASEADKQDDVALKNNPDENLSSSSDVSNSKVADLAEIEAKKERTDTTEKDGFSLDDVIKTAATVIGVGVVTKAGADLFSSDESDDEPKKEAPEPKPDTETKLEPKKVSFSSEATIHSRRNLQRFRR